MDNMLQFLKDSKFTVNIDTKSAEELGRCYKEAEVKKAEIYQAQKKTELEFTEIELQREHTRSIIGIWFGLMGAIICISIFSSAIFFAVHFK